MRTPIGKPFLELVLVVLFCANLPASLVLSEEADTILLPPPVQVLPPPAQSEQTLQEELTRRKTWLQKVTGTTEVAPPTPSEKRNEALKEASRAPISLRLGVEWCLRKPWVSTTGSARSDYRVDPGSEVSLFVRPLGGDAPFDGMSYWLGLSLLPFTGTGEHSGVTARYGVLYTGLTASVGRFTESTEVLTEAKGEGEKPVLGFTSRRGWLLTLGAGATPRFSSVDPTVDPSGTDFEPTRSFVTEGLGLFVEARWVQIYFGALGVHLVTGAALGVGKRFYWAGLGLGGWQ